MLLHYLLVILTFSEEVNCFRIIRTKNRNNARIFNGQTASKNQFPWHVFLEITFKDKRSKTGGGVLISKKHILTCAHVFYHSKVNSYNDKLNEYNGEAYFGITDMAKDIKDAKVLEFNKKDVTLYPDNHKPVMDQINQQNYPEDQYHKLIFFYYDIAIVTIKDLSKDILPICLPGKHVLKTIEGLKFDQEITIVGIGQLNKHDNNVKNRKLQYGTVNRIDEKKCYQTWYPNKRIPDHFYEIENTGLCVKGKFREIIGCHGDSGSPAIWKHNDKDYLIGIHSEDQNDCEIPNNKPVAHSKYVAIPGVLVKWIEKKGGKEIENMLQKC